MEELAKGEFINIESENSKNRVRAYRLNNGDIFTVYGMLLEFEDDILYGVVARQVEHRGEVDNNCSTYNITQYFRTGISFTLDEINQLVKELKYWNKK